MAAIIRISCPKCQRILPLRAEHIGRRINCKGCNHIFRAELPAAGQAAPAVDVPTPRSTPVVQPANVLLQPELARQEVGQLQADFLACQTAYQEQVDSLTRQVHAVSADRDRLADEVTQLKGRLSASTAISERLCQDIKTDLDNDDVLQGMWESLSPEAERLWVKVRELQHSLAEAAVAREEVEKQLLHERGHAAAERAQLEAARKQLALDRLALDNKIEHFRRDVESMQQTLAEKARGAASSDVEAALRKSEKECAALQQQLDRSRQENSALRQAASDCGIYIE